MKDDQKHSTKEEGQHHTQHDCCAQHEHLHDGHDPAHSCCSGHSHHDHDDHHCHEHGCSCHDHHHEHGTEEGFPLELLIAAILFVLCLVLEHLLTLPVWAVICMYLVPYLLAGHHTIAEAIEGIAHGAVFGEEFLMTAASVGAFAVGSYEEGAAVMLLFGLGEYLEGLAVGKTRASVKALMALRPDTAHVVTSSNTVTDCKPEDVEVGAVIEIRPGERIPLDGTILSGTAAIDTSALTGESLPRTAGIGDTVSSGCVCTDGVLQVRVIRRASESTAARILEMTENAASRKTRTEAFLTRFSRIYTPAVVAAALLVAVIPSLITGAWSVWVHRALTFLVVSCPCALVISVPLTFFCGIGAASSHGILIKGSAALDALAKTAVVATDKTGTLTEGKLHVTEIKAPTEDKKLRLLTLAAHAECFSSHPLALAIRAGYTKQTGQQPDSTCVSDLHEEAGKGISAIVTENGTAVSVLTGNRALLESHHIPCSDAASEDGASIYVAADGEYLGRITAKDALKADAQHAIAACRTAGVREIHMLTGDTAGAAQKVADTLHLDGCHAELLPDGKLQTAEALKAKCGENETLLCIGDGINDAPLLAMADVGAAMGGLGSDAAMEAADIVIMDDKPEKIPAAILLAKKTMRIARQNIVFALAVKLCIMILGAIGKTGMWAAVFGDVGVCMLCILNATRARRN